jgi:hypothetical protein
MEVMDISVVMRCGWLAAALAAGGALAQSQTQTEAQVEPAVLTDVAPLPAEDRDSVGAIVLENSMVRAQRAALAGRYTPARVTSIGRGAMRAARSARTREELQQQRDEDAMRLHEMGAGALTQP